ncbi:MAG TPA: hypothetical protein VOA87_14950 [Thermoanaerobaculia bacterium]|nr:hypothetical protein [Thermoanaerobaculia bacterium]
MGLFRSGDAGASFQPSNGSGGTALGLSNVTAVAVQPGNSNLVLAGGPGYCSSGSLSGAGLRRSTDGGATWSLVLNGQPNDIAFDPAIPSTVYASIGGSNTPDCGVFKSTDTGATWTKLTNGITAGSYSYLRLAMAPTNRSVLYALVQTSGTTGALYRTLDGGTTCSPVPTQTTFELLGSTATEPIVSVPTASNSGLQNEPPSTLFHSPPDAVPR